MAKSCPFCGSNVVFIIDKYKCKVCGKLFNPNDVSHIIPTVSDEEFEDRQNYAFANETLDLKRNFDKD